MIDEKGNVLPALTNGWHLHHHDAHAIVEILTEAPIQAGLQEILVGGRDEPDVGTERRRAADFRELPALEDTKKLDLKRKPHLGQLIHEKGAAIGEREDAFAILGGSRERALDMTEQMTLQEAFGDRDAVEGDERSVASRASEVHGAGNELLAGAAFSLDADAGIACSDLLDHREDPQHLLRATDKTMEGRLDERDVGQGQAKPPLGAAPKL